MKRPSGHRPVWPRVAAVVAFAVMAWGPASSASPAGDSEEAAEQQQLVAKAQLTLEAFSSYPELLAMIRDGAQDIKAIFIVPQLVRGAFIVGGAGGSGLLLVKYQETGEWSQPAFYTIGSASFGLQIGLDTSELLMLVRTDRGLKKFYHTSFTLGGDATMSLGPVGEGASLHGMKADLVSYARSKGAFAGIVLDEAVIVASDEANRAYYQQPVKPIDILLKGSVSNPGSEQLRKAADALLK
ncbi:MAG TPA: lipid-binding SYLF domain-containing protein [Nitrospiraceae bacterium]|nr:lipid-binding SYLF domain-containing protein [Nitrospiraceae bacterium]